MNSVTYFVVVKSLAALGKSQGVLIRRKDVDLAGNSTQAQFDVNLQVGDLLVPITMTCFHTTSNIHVQLKGKKKEARWSDKLIAVEQFVYGNVVDMISKVESMPTYNDIRTSIINDLSIKAGRGQVTSVAPDETTELLSNRESNSYEDHVTMGSSKLAGCQRSFAGDISLNIVNETEQTTTSEIQKDVDSIVDTHGEVCVEPESSVMENVNSVTVSEMNTLDTACAVNETALSEVALTLEVRNDAKSVASDPVLHHDESKAVVVRNKVHSKDNKQLYQALNVLRGEKNMDQQVKALYSIITQLRNKGIEMMAEYKVIHQPQYSDNLNRVTLKLFEKQNEVDGLKKKSKEQELQIKDLKKGRVEKEKELSDMQKKDGEKDVMIQSMKADYKKLQEKVSMESSEVPDRCNELESSKKSDEGQLAKIFELESLLQGKEEVIKELQVSNDDLVKRCKSLTANEVQLSSRIQTLETLSSHIDDGVRGEVVVVHARSAKENSDNLKEEVAVLNQKIDKLNKENSLLKDQLSEKSGSLQKIDEFYKEIVDQKDQVICDLQAITSKDGDLDAKYKKLLLKFRSDHELKLMKELKSNIAENSDNASSTSSDKIATTNVGINTDPALTQCKCKCTVGGDKPSSAVNEGDNNSGENGSRIGFSPIAKPKMCKFGLKCSNKDTCEFSHEIIQKACRFGVRCTKGGACLFLHENGNVNSAHAGARESEWVTGFITNNRGFANVVGNRFVPQKSGIYAVNQGTADTHHNNNRCDHFERDIYRSNQEGFSGTNMMRRDGNSLNPSAGHNNNINTRLCRNGRICEIVSCVFRHELINKACKFGAGCTRKNTCLFRHDIEHNIQFGGSNMNPMPRNENQMGFNPKNVHGRV